MTNLLIGLGLGVLLTIPLAAVAARRAERRVRKLEQRARAAERLAELGTMTGGLAHEIKNPLSTVGLNVQLLREDLQTLRDQLPPDAEPQRDKLSRIERRFDSLSRETQRLRQILEDFLRFAGRVKLDLHDANVNLIVDELAEFFLPQAQEACVRIRTQLLADPPAIHADPSLLKQALLNLMINATQAMAQARQQDKPHGGADELIVRTERKRAASRGDRPEVLIHVTDTGPGIPPENRDKIFQPYFSTKKGGTGLGLPTTRRIIEEHGGTITVHSEPGRGTDFVIALPS